MSHEITETDHMVSGNDILPWHGLGTVVSGLMTSTEVLAKAHLDWHVSKKSIQICGDKGKFGKGIKDHFATVRDDTGDPLGIVGKIYTPIQNSDGLNILDPIIGKDAVYETAGSLRGGRVVWFLASLKKEYFLSVKGGSDKMKQYFLVYISHDGTKPASVRFVSTRVVCMNTLSCALGEAPALVSIRHTKNYQEKMEEVTRIVGLADQHAREFEKVYAQLANTSVTETQAKDFTRAIFPGEAAQSIKLQDQLFSLFQRGVGNQGKTRADLLNAVTEFESHHKAVRAKTPEAIAASRFENNLFGYGLTVQAKALDLLMAN